jgi:two-component system cell cycle response regulator DivK
MSKRILVVEDQPDSRQIIRDMLTGTDYEITEAENGEDALTAIEKQRPDLILMDIQLPIMDGYTATNQIKANPALRSIPIIAVTSYALAMRRNRRMGSGNGSAESERSPTILAHESARAQRMADFFEDHVADPLMQGPPGMAHLTLAVAVEMARKRGLGDLTAGRRRLTSWMRSISDLPSMQRTAPP